MDPLLESATNEVRSLLAQRTAGFLTSTVVEPGVTCAVCRTPIESQYRTCYPCLEHIRIGLPRADRVGFLTYGVQDQQSGHMMRTYKGRAGFAVSTDARLNVKLLLWLGMTHAACAGRLAERPVTHWSVVPSVPPAADRPVHPLQQILEELLPESFPLASLAAGTSGSLRSLRFDAFTADGLSEGAHVLLIDDTWVSGGHAQSAANALKRAGAQEVSTLVVARWLDPRFPTTRAFLASRRDLLGPALATCPWTVDACP